jgi:hypothetical protein
MLESQEGRARYDIVTLVESWFDLCPELGLIGLVRGDILPGRERHVVQYPKPSTLPKGWQFARHYYVTETLTELNKWR